MRINWRNPHKPSKDLGADRLSSNKVEIMEDGPVNHIMKFWIRFDFTNGNETKRNDIIL